MNTVSPTNLCSQLQICCTKVGKISRIIISNLKALAEKVAIYISSLFNSSTLSPREMSEPVAIPSEAIAIPSEAIAIPSEAIAIPSEPLAISSAIVPYNAILKYHLKAGMTQQEAIDYLDSEISKQFPSQQFHQLLMGRCPSLEVLARTNIDENVLLTESFLKNLASENSRITLAAIRTDK